MQTYKKLIVFKILDLVVYTLLLFETNLRSILQQTWKNMVKFDRHFFKRLRIPPSILHINIATRCNIPSQYCSQKNIRLTLIQALHGKLLNSNNADVSKIFLKTTGEEVMTKHDSYAQGNHTRNISFPTMKLKF